MDSSSDVGQCYLCLSPGTFEVKAKKIVGLFSEKVLLGKYVALPITYKSGSDYSYCHSYSILRRRYGLIVLSWQETLGTNASCPHYMYIAIDSQAGRPRD